MKIQKRKSDHIDICLNRDVELGGAGFEDVLLDHNALPELDLEKVDTSVRLFGKKLNAPIIIEAMTGGSKEGKDINRDLASVAEELGIGIGVGSQRAAIEDDKVADTFSVVADAAPKTLKIANLGAVQLNYGYGVRECRKAVEMINADVLALHLNPLQEAVQPEGDTNFSGLLPKISKVCNDLNKPVIAKEVGSGITLEVAKRLKKAGVKAIDIGGAGGTSWSLVEGYRADSSLGIIFADWGIPTVECLLDLQPLKMPKIASGGIRTGIDAAKALSLGADAVGIALPLLKAWKDKGKTGVELYLNAFIRELRVSMFLTGSADVKQLQRP